MDRGAGGDTVHKVTESLLKRLSTHTHTHLRSVLLFPNSFISYAKNFRLDGTVDRLPHPKLKARTMSPGNILQTPYSGVKPISQLYHVIRKCLYRN